MRRGSRWKTGDVLAVAALTHSCLGLHAALVLPNTGETMGLRRPPRCAPAACRAAHERTGRDVQGGQNKGARIMRIITPKSLATMTPGEFAAAHDHAAAEPAVLRDVWAHGDSGREDWCEAVVAQLTATEVEYQVQTGAGSELFTARFERFLEDVFESTSGESAFLFDENVMTQLPHLRGELALPDRYFGTNLFDEFPLDLRPKDSCLIVGGEGAHSTLHVDPFDWFGTNYCLEGSKLWTFVAPDPLGATDRPVDRALEAYRVEPNAWAEDEVEGVDVAGGNAQRPEIAAGWQSDQYIFAGVQAKEWPTSRELGEMQPGQRLAALDVIARDAARAVVRGAGRKGVEASRIRVALQKEGEMVLIPPGWWHQTLHIEASIALASQYTNVRSVLRHRRRMCLSACIYANVRVGVHTRVDHSVHVRTVCLCVCVPKHDQQTRTHTLSHTHHRCTQFSTTSARGAVYHSTSRLSRLEKKHKHTSFRLPLPALSTPHARPSSPGLRRLMRPQIPLVLECGSAPAVAPILLHFEMEGGTERDRVTDRQPAREHFIEEGKRAPVSGATLRQMALGTAMTGESSQCSRKSPAMD